MLGSSTGRCFFFRSRKLTGRLLCQRHDIRPYMFLFCRHKTVSRQNFPKLIDKKNKKVFKLFFCTCGAVYLRFFLVLEKKEKIAVNSILFWRNYAEHIRRKTWQSNYVAHGTSTIWSHRNPFVELRTHIGSSSRHGGTPEGRRLKAEDPRLCWWNSCLTFDSIRFYFHNLTRAALKVRVH